MSDLRKDIETLMNYKSGPSEMPKLAIDMEFTREGRVTDEYIDALIPYTGNLERYAQQLREDATKAVAAFTAEAEQREKLSADLAEARSQLAAAREGLRKIYNCGQSIEPDHWKFRCMARDVARDTLSRLSPSPKQSAGRGEFCCVHCKRYTMHEPGKLCELCKGRHPVDWRNS